MENPIIRTNPAWNNLIQEIWSLALKAANWDIKICDWILNALKSIDVDETLWEDPVEPGEKQVKDETKKK